MRRGREPNSSNYSNACPIIRRSISPPIAVVVLPKYSAHSAIAQDVNFTNAIVEDVSGIESIPIFSDLEVCNPIEDGSVGRAVPKIGLHHSHAATNTCDQK